METSDWIAISAGFVAFFALGVSLITLWQTHFIKFSPVLTVGCCSFRIFTIKSENERWYLPSFNLPISFTNKGARLGNVEDMRIRVSFPGLPILGNYEMFYAKWIVDGKKITQERYKWIEKAIIEDWIPFVLLPRQTITKHIVFESRWDEPVIQEEVLCELEIRANKSNQWKKITQWKYHLLTDEWSELAEVGTSFNTYPDDYYLNKDDINPMDLHKYTGTKEEIPKNGFKAAPSYLDYPENK